MFLKESLLLSLHTFLIFFVAFPPELSPLSVNENADGCDAAGQQHIVCQQRRKCNDDEPHLVDKIDTRLFARKAAGIQTYGGQSAQVLDASGKLRTIKFSRPTPVLIYVQISDLVTSDAYAGDAALKAAIVEYIGSAAGDIAESGLAIGETVYYNRLMCPVNNTPGVVDYTLKVSTDGKTWSKNNIAIDARKKAITGTDKVVIVT